MLIKKTITEEREIEIELSLPAFFKYGESYAKITEAGMFEVNNYSFKLGDHFCAAGSCGFNPEFFVSKGEVISEYEFDRVYMEVQEKKSILFYKSLQTA